MTGYILGFRHSPIIMFPIDPRFVVNSENIKEIFHANSGH
jgi:hypothetical protein